MPLAFTLDEHLTGPLWSAIQRHNHSGGPFIDAVRVGDPPDLPGGSKDPDILRWCEREGRLLLTFDRNTMPRHLADHLQAGHHSPGVVILLEGYGLPDLINALELTAYAGFPDDYRDQIRYLP